MFDRKSGRRARAPKYTPGCTEERPSGRTAGLGASQNWTAESPLYPRARHRIDRPALGRQHDQQARSDPGSRPSFSYQRLWLRGAGSRNAHDGRPRSRGGIEAHLAVVFTLSTIAFPTTSACHSGARRPSASDVGSRERPVPVAGSKSSADRTGWRAAACREHVAGGETDCRVPGPRVVHRPADRPGTRTRVIDLGLPDEVLELVHASAHEHVAREEERGLMPSPGKIHRAGRRRGLCDRIVHFGRARPLIRSSVRQQGWEHRRCQ